MPYRFLENTAIADVAFEATGSDFEELLRGAWDAALATMIIQPDRIEKVTSRSVQLEHEQADLLLYDFLQELLFYKDAESMLLKIDRLTVRRAGTVYQLDALLAGEKIDRARHEMSVDVKAVTLHQLRVEHGEGGWRATVVLDV
jgi:SHS2 domain-containing protein